MIIYDQVTIFFNEKLAVYQIFILMQNCEWYQSNKKNTDFI